MSFSEITSCLKSIQEMKFYLRTGFVDPKCSYSDTMINNFQGIQQGNGVELVGWFMIICILMLYLK